MTIKIKIDNKTGEVKKVLAPLPDDGTTGRTRMSRAALVLWKGKFEPTFWFKFRRFFKRSFDIISDLAAQFCDDESVAALPYIGLEDGR